MLHNVPFLEKLQSKRVKCKNLLRFRLIHKGVVRGETMNDLSAPSLVGAPKCFENYLFIIEKILDEMLNVNM